MADKSYMFLKVYSIPGAYVKDGPVIRLQGDWLERLGFVFGTSIMVKCEKRKLTITILDEEPPSLHVSGKKAITGIENLSRKTG